MSGQPSAAPPRVASDPDALQWGLVIATKDRLDILVTCVELALTQTRPPMEVVVADSSADWSKHAEIIGDVVRRFPGIRFVYEQGQAPSLTVQRNQAIARSTADILFMIDDDSLMHPDCAAHIMAGYEADTAGVLGGIQASLSPDVPQGAQVSQARKQTGNDVSAGGANTRKRKTLLTRLGQWAKRYVLLMNMEEMFIPYRMNQGGRAAFVNPPALPPELTRCALVPATLFHGCRMTYRRAVIAKHQFDPLLLYYCPGEDVDASYRVSGSAQLATAQSALLHHYTASSGRIDRYKTTILSTLNQGVMLSRHASNKGQAKQDFLRLMRRRLVAEFIKDGLSRRFDFPQMRGLLAARKQALAAFAMRPDELASWYPKMQEQIVKGP